MERQNSYTIDKDGRILDVDENWDIFAIENNAKDNTLKDQVIGKKITSFITSDHVRMWFESLISLAQISGKRVEREYRCDSPYEKRYMLMIIIPLKNGNLLVEHYLLKTEKIDKTLELDFSEKSSDSAIRCSVCGKFNYDDKWIEIDELAKIVDIFKLSVSDVVCNSCTLKIL